MKAKANKKSLLPLIKLISKLKSNDIPDVLDLLSDKGINGICECVYNVIFTQLNLSKRKRNLLKKKINKQCSLHKLKRIVGKDPIFKRRRYLKQQASGLPLILATAIPFLANLIFGKK
jgi:hypothetical protein